MRKMMMITLFLITAIVGCNSSSNGEYQVTIDADSIHLYDGNRYVGSLASSSVPALDSLIIEDNR